MKLRKSVIRAVLRGARPPFASQRMGVGGRRLMLALLTAAARPPKGTGFERVTVAGVPVERVQPPQSGTQGTLIYLHGGAYALGSAKGYRGMVAQPGRGGRYDSADPRLLPRTGSPIPDCPRGNGRGLLPVTRGRARPENYCYRR